MQIISDGIVFGRDPVLGNDEPDFTAEGAWFPEVQPTDLGAPVLLVDHAVDVREGHAVFVPALMNFELISEIENPDLARAPVSKRCNIPSQ